MGTLSFYNTQLSVHYNVICMCENKKIKSSNEKHICKINVITYEKRSVKVLEEHIMHGMERTRFVCQQLQRYNCDSFMRHPSISTSFSNYVFLNISIFYEVGALANIILAYFDLDLKL